MAFSSTTLVIVTLQKSVDLLAQLFTGKSRNAVGC